MKTKTPNYYIFLSLVWITGILDIVISFLCDGYLPADLVKFKESLMDQYHWQLFAVIIPIILVFLASLIALWWKARWARHGFTISFLLCVAVTPAFGPMIENGVSACMIIFTHTIDGAFIALLYFSEWDQQFFRKPITAQ